jgi:ADP-ribosylglycohydrolase
MRFGLIFRDCFPDLIPNAPVDDDTNYTALYMKLFERLGRDFTPADIARWWLIMQPKNAYCTAERVAYVNFTDNVLPPASASYHNAYREWIGAQIRADYFGYINPGDPETAAEMAWRDARISHVKNGIYGEMLVAAMIAAAATESDLEKIIEAGLNEIPEKSRLQCEIRALIAKYHSNASEDELFAWIHTLYDEHSEYGWCHTNANALIVCASMLVTGGDYSRAICRAVQTGFDTDCNGATVGSILGMRGGLKCIDEKWLKPLHGALDTSIVGMGTVKIDELIDKTLSHIVTA